MTEQEAKLLLGLQDGEDVLDKWDEVLFEYKQFFLSKPLIPKLIEGRIRKLKNAVLAFRVISRATEHQISSQPELTFYPVPKVLESFHRYQSFRMQLKSFVMSAMNAEQLIDLLSRALILEKKWLEKWSLTNLNVEESSIVVSKEPDPMELLNGIKLWVQTNQEGTFGELHNDVSFLPEVVLHELKRLTLLHQKYFDGGSI
jgi:hypothetical protein